MSSSATAPSASPDASDSLLPIVPDVAQRPAAGGPKVPATGPSGASRAPGQQPAEPRIQRSLPPRELLRLFTVSEAQQRGGGPLDRAEQFVYEAIFERSLPGNLTTGDLFLLEKAELQSALLEDLSVPEIVHRLQKRRLVLALPCFEFRAEQGWLEPRVYLVARQDDAEQLLAIYEELSQLSHRSIVAWMEGLGSIGASLRQDLEADLRPNVIPPAAGIAPDDLHSWSEARETAVLFDPLIALQRAHYTAQPAAALLRHFAEDQRRLLIQDRSALAIGRLGFLPFRESEVLDCFEAARDFLESQVVPEYLNEAPVRREIDRIALEEALYEIDVARAVTGRFAAARAGVLQRLAFQGGESAEASGMLTAKPGALEHQPRCAPGELACEIVLRLANHAEQQYNNQWKESAAEFAADFVAELQAHRNDWRRMIRYITQEQLSHFHPEVLNILRHHPDLFYQVYERPKGSIHLFALRNAEEFRLLLRGMLELPTKERWRIVALRAMIESYEHRFRKLFADDEFVRDYGRLLRKAYIDYMPVWARIFLYSGLSSLRDYFFDRARLRIQREQAYLARRNARLFEKQQKQEKETRRRMIYGMRDMSCAQDLIAALERSYFDEGRIPTVGEIVRSIPGMQRAELERVLKAARFKVLRSRPARGLRDRVRARAQSQSAPASGSPEAPAAEQTNDTPAAEEDLLETGILLFPRNGDYPDRMRRLQVVATSLNENPAADAAGAEQQRRARRLLGYLQSSQNFVVR